MKDVQKSPGCTQGLMGNTGEVDQTESATRGDLEARRKALSAVSAPDLVPFRDACVLTLDSLLAPFKK